MLMSVCKFYVQHDGVEYLRKKAMKVTFIMIVTDLFNFHSQVMFRTSISQSSIPQPWTGYMHFCIIT